jgi:hypothetical protein
MALNITSIEIFWKKKRGVCHSAKSINRGRYQMNFKIIHKLNHNLMNHEHKNKTCQNHKQKIMHCEHKLNARKDFRSTAFLLI